MSTFAERRAMRDRREMLAEWERKRRRMVSDCVTSIFQERSQMIKDNPYA